MAAAALAKACAQRAGAPTRAHQASPLPRSRRSPGPHLTQTRTNPHQTRRPTQIECDGVDYVSRTFDPFLDLSLEINRAASLERALAAFTAAEVLDGANKYRCPKNNKLVRRGGEGRGGEGRGERRGGASEGEGRVKGKGERRGGAGEGEGRAKWSMGGGRWRGREIGERYACPGLRLRVPCAPISVAFMEVLFLLSHTRHHTHTKRTHQTRTGPRHQAYQH